jgi:outer membrane lipoprotein-sorting protein
MTAALIVSCLAAAMGARPIHAAKHPGGQTAPSRAARSRAVQSPKPKIPTAAELYERSREADDLFSYAGRQVINNWRTGRLVAVQISHRRDGWERIEYIAPEADRGRAIVSNKQRQWRYDPKARTLTIRDVPRSQVQVDEAAESYSLLRDNYILSFLPATRTFADRKTFVLSIAKQSNKKPARRLWIDAATSIVLKREIYHDAPAPSATVAFSDINFHPAFKPDTFSLPGMHGEKGIRIVTLRPDPEKPIPLASVGSQLGNKAVTPARLAGYELVGAGLLYYKGGRVALHLRYSDGLNLISLFETQRRLTARPTRVPSVMRPKQIGPVNAHVTKHSSLTTINWDTGALNLTLMGEVPESTLSQFVSAIGG